MVCLISNFAALKGANFRVAAGHVLLSREKSCKWKNGKGETNSVFPRCFNIM